MPPQVVENRARTPALPDDERFNLNHGSRDHWRYISYIPFRVKPAR